MAVYKVPQDVEADDKLIGPFSFRQFIYLIVVALAIAAAWGLSRIFLPLLIIPLPIIIFFGALALPLRKDQPMEIYLAAMVSFYLKPRRRMWDPDGIESLIEITVPKTVEVQRTKNLSQNEAQERFGYLAQLVDSQGWAVRGQGVQAPNSPMNSDVYFEAQQAEDILDVNTTVSQTLDHMIDQSDNRRHQEMINRMHQPPTVAPQPPLLVDDTKPYDFFTQPPVQAVPSANSPFNQPLDPSLGNLAFNPYPTDIQQTVIQPIGDSKHSTKAPVRKSEPKPVANTTPITSEKPVSPDIINLANNADLSIETIAREANRIHQKEDMDKEVIISLR